MKRPITFECIWERTADNVRREVMELWSRYGALREESHLEKRAGEIVFVVRDGHGQIGGVSTARPVRVPFLNNHFFYEFRCFIAPQLSVPGLDSALAVKTKDLLEAQYGPAGKYKGIVMIIENQELKKQRTKGIWPATGMVFAGYTAKGAHIRVGYFKGARI